MSGLDKFIKKPPKKAKIPENAGPESPVIIKPASGKAAKPPKAAKKRIAKTPAKSSVARKPQTKHRSRPAGVRVAAESEIASPEIAQVVNPRKIPKFLLTCTNSKCKYKRILMKAALTPNDLVCPKCQSPMREKEA